MKKSKRIYLTYTVLFVVLCVIAFAPFILQGKVLIWTQVEDGLTQHFASLTYWGEYLRSFGKNLISGNFSLPMWDMKLGYGGDILSTLNYYAIGDPLTLLSAFIPRAHMDVFYTFLYFLRMYLAGISFIVFCRYMKRDEMGTLLGALCYIFCSFVMLGATRHPFFINPMIYLPLLLMGVEKVFRKEKPYQFVIMTGIAAVSNFYFFYMLTIFIFFYALIRYADYEEGFQVKSFIQTVGRFLVYYVLGIGLFAILFLPILMGFFQNGRTSTGATLGFYSMRFYKNIIIVMFGNGRTESWTMLGYLPIIALALGVVFFQKEKGFGKYRIGLILMAIGIGLPVIGYVMNGFSYATNRWVFLFGFLLSYTLAGVYPKLFEMKKHTKILTGLFVLLFSAMGMYMFVQRGMSLAMLIMFIVPAVCMCATYGWVLLVQGKGWKYNGAMTSMVIILLVAGSVASQGYSNFVADNLTSQYIKKGQALKLLTSENVKMLKDVKDPSIYRVDDEENQYRNYGILSGLYTLNGYYSITNGAITEALRSQENASMTSDFKYYGVDQREELLATTAVKYITLSKRKVVPDGYIKIREGKNSNLYMNTNALPFGYSYSDYMIRKEYEKLNGVEKQNAMLQTAIVEKELQGYKESKKGFKLPAYSVKKNCMEQWNQGEVTSVKKEQVTVKAIKHIKVNLHTKPGTYTYIRFKNVRYTPKSNQYVAGKIMVKGNHSNQSNIRVYHKKQKYYFGRDTAVVSLKDSTYVDIALTYGATYKFDDIEIISYKKANLKKYTTNIQKLQDIEYNGNVYEATSKADRKQIVCVPIPYSKGWTAYVDGKKTKIYQVNDMYQGLCVDKGRHKIRMVYRTPGMKVGALISIVSLLILLWMIRREKRSGEDINSSTKL